MSSRTLFASNLIACWLAAVLLGDVPAVNAASAARSFLKSGETARIKAIEIRRRVRGPRIHLPMGPAYIYYDYPYYYSRGYYPTHIGGYVYYPEYFSYYPGYGVQCSNRHQVYAGNWGCYRNSGSAFRQKARRKHRHIQGR